MCSPLHRGHFPGEVNRCLPSKTKPHSRQREGIIFSFLFCDFTERPICSRCSKTSFSLMRRILEMDFAPYTASDRRVMISRLMVLITAPASDRHCVSVKCCYSIDNLDFSDFFLRLREGALIRKK